MNRPMLDMLMRRPRMMPDGRNPYGSKGGYVVSRDPRRSDRAREGYHPMYDSNYGREPYYNDGRQGVRGTGMYGMGGSRYYGRDGLMYDDMQRYQEGQGEYNLAEMTRQRQPIRHDPYQPHIYENYDGKYYPFEVMGAFQMDEIYPDRMMYDPRMRDPRYMYQMYDGAEEGMLTDRELDKWADRLLREVEEKDKPFFKFENIKNRAETMGIKFDEFTPMELLVASLMEYTDYAKTIGTANMDVFIRLGKDFLCDPDSDLKGGEKLAAYYDIVARR